MCTFSMCALVCTPHTHTHTRVPASACRDAWMKLGAMSKEEAMQKYIDFVTTLMPDWRTRIPLDGAGQRVSDSEAPLSATLMQVTVS